MISWLRSHVLFFARRKCPVNNNKKTKQTFTARAKSNGGKGKNVKLWRVKCSPEFSSPRFLLDLMSNLEKICSFFLSSFLHFVCLFIYLGFFLSPFSPRKLGVTLRRVTPPPVKCRRNCGIWIENSLWFLFNFLYIYTTLLGETEKQQQQRKKKQTIKINKSIFLRMKPREFVGKNDDKKKN